MKSLLAWLDLIFFYWYGFVFLPAVDGTSGKIGSLLLLHTMHVTVNCEIYFTMNSYILNILYCFFFLA